MEFQIVRITPNTRQKYVLVKVTKDTKKLLLLWGNPNVEWHKDIVEEIKSNGFEIIEILGGGWLLRSTNEGITYVWGKSDRFGEAPIQLVRQTLTDTVVNEEPK